MVISFEFRMEQNRDGNHREDAPHFSMLYTVKKFRLYIEINDDIESFLKLINGRRK